MEASINDNVSKGRNAESPYLTHAWALYQQEDRTTLSKASLLFGMSCAKPCCQSKSTTLINPQSVLHPDINSDSHLCPVLLKGKRKSFDHDQFCRSFSISMNSNINKGQKPDRSSNNIKESFPFLCDVLPYTDRIRIRNISASLTPSFLFFAGASSSV